MLKTVVRISGLPASTRLNSPESGTIAVDVLKAPHASHAVQRVTKPNSKFVRGWAVSLTVVELKMFCSSVLIFAPEARLSVVFRNTRSKATDVSALKLA